MIWETIALSDDRRTITVTTSYPLAGVCIKQPDGVDIEIDGEIAVVAAWMRGPDLPLPENTACTDECARATQSVMLDEPLPEQVKRFEPTDGAVSGCL